MFRDRLHAGRALAAELRPLAEEEPVILAIPRGGVPIAFEIAGALHAPMDLITVRKLGAPQNPEYAVGAVAEDGSAVLDTDVARRLGLSRGQINDVVQRELRELDRRIELYRDGWEPMDVHCRTVIIVDDGLATGLSDLAAVRALRRRGAARVIVAAPVASRYAVDLLREEADEVICVSVPDDFRGVGAWYEDFSPVSDEQVLRLMVRAGAQAPAGSPAARPVTIEAGHLLLHGDLTVPEDARGLVIFAHGSGSSRLSPRNRSVASTLVRRGFATLLFDLLAAEEEGVRELVFDIPLLAGRLELTTRWAASQRDVGELPVGYLGASTGAAAALTAAAALRDGIGAVVSRGGRPDLAGDVLPSVAAPTLLIVGGLDTEVLELNRLAAARMRCEHRVAVVDGASHLFEEPGTLQSAARLAGDWFDEHLAGSPAEQGAAAAGGA